MPDINDKKYPEGDFQIALAELKASSKRYKEFLEIFIENFTFHAQTSKKLYDAFVAEGYTKAEALDLVKHFYKQFFI